MQMSAKTTWWLTFLLVALQGATTLSWNTLGMDPHYVAVIGQGISYAQFLLMFAIHGSIPGVQAVAMPDVPKAAIQAQAAADAAKKVILLAVLIGAMFLIPGHAHAAGKVTKAQATSNPISVLTAFTVQDLQNALADAQAQSPPDVTAATCYTALIPIVQSGVGNPLPKGLGAFQALQKARDAKAFLANLQSPSGPLAALNIACAPLVLDGQNTLIQLGILGGAVTATQGLVLPIALPFLP